MPSVLLATLPYRGWTMSRLPNRLALAGILFFVVALAGPSAPPSMAQSQASTQGQWQTLPYTMPINPVHVALLRTGKVLIVSGSGNFPPDTNYQAGLWDPQAGTISRQPIAWDMFCNGMGV